MDSAQCSVMPGLVEIGCIMTQTHAAVVWQYFVLAHRQPGIRLSVVAAHFFAWFGVPLAFWGFVAWLAL